MRSLNRKQFLKLLGAGGLLNQFGKMEIVKPMLDFFPAALNARGPHGFTLLHHAVKGGDDAEEVRKYLEDLGAKERKVN